MFFDEVHDFLMGSGHYSELKVTCARHIYSSQNEVRLAQRSFNVNKY